MPALLCGTQLQPLSGQNHPWEPVHTPWLAAWEAVMGQTEQTQGLCRPSRDCCTGRCLAGQPQPWQPSWQHSPARHSTG